MTIIKKENYDYCGGKNLPRTFTGVRSVCRSRTILFVRVRIVRVQSEMKIQIKKRKLEAKNISERLN